MARAAELPIAKRYASLKSTSSLVISVVVGKASTAMKVPYFQSVNSQDLNQSRGLGPVWMRNSQKVSSSRWVVLRVRVRVEHK
jgi:hypothetical protein